METLIEVFDEHFSKLKFDTKLVKSIYQYQIAYVNKNPEHLEFFGGNLLGVQVVRFKDSDVNRMFNEVLDIDYDLLKRDIRKLKTIDHTYKISGDIFNLTMMYLIHRFLTTDTLPENVRIRAAYDTALIFFYRCVAALLSYYFRYPADPKIAQQAYAQLSNKFLIKKLGSWNKVMDYRANDLIDKSGIHYKNLVKFRDDFTIVAAINDAQSRVKDIIKNYCAQFYTAHSEGNSISVTSSTYLDADGEETLKEKTRSPESYIAYMRNALIDKHTFVKDDLVSIIIKINSNTSFRMVRHTLLWMSENYANPKIALTIDEFMSSVIVQSLYLMQNNMNPKKSRDYSYVLVSLKNLYLSTRTTDPEIEKIRNLGMQVIKTANGNIGDSLALATRTSMILYITLRAIIGQNINR